MLVDRLLSAGPNVDGVARRDPPSRSGRLAAVLGRDDPPTEPLPVASPAAGGRSGWGRRVLAGLLPASWCGARIDPGRSGAIALALVAAAAAVLAAFGVWSDRPRVEPVSGLSAVTVTPATTDARDTGSAPVDPAEPLVVSVSGKVERPGLVEVPAGARVADVLAAAGGVLPGTDLTAVNLARRVTDGEQVAVGVPPAPDAAGSGGAEPVAGAPVGKINLNSATAAELDALPGVGPVTAARILEWRTSHGRFARVDQLREIEGIGERRFGQLRELVTV